MTHCSTYRTSLLCLFLATALPICIYGCGESNPGGPRQKSVQEVIDTIENIVKGLSAYQKQDEADKTRMDQVFKDTLKPRFQNISDINAAVEFPRDSSPKQTLLMIVADLPFTSLKILDVLSENGAKWDVKNELGETALYTLLINMQDEEELTTWEGKEIEPFESYKKLLQIIKKSTSLKTLMECKNNEQRTIMHALARGLRNQYYIIRALTEHFSATEMRALANKEDEHGETPLDIAIERFSYKEKPVLEELLSAIALGEDPEMKETDGDICQEVCRVFIAHVKKDFSSHSNNPRYGENYEKFLGIFKLLKRCEYDLSAVIKLLKEKQEVVSPLDKDYSGWANNRKASVKSLIKVLEGE